MGRSLEFSVDLALEKALDVFRRHGFEGSSVLDLANAMGISKPSLYAVYGNKEALFMKALQLYEECHLSSVRDALRDVDAARAVVRLLDAFADAVTAPAHPTGCLLTSGALACSTVGEPMRRELALHRAKVEHAVRTRLQRAEEAGDLPVSTTSADLAFFIATVMQGMAVQAASGASREALARVAAAALAPWSFGSGRSREAAFEKEAAHDVCGRLA